MSENASMCPTCGDVYALDREVCHDMPWPVAIEPCPIPGNDDRRFKTYHSCDSEHHHYGRGEHVRILARVLLDQGQDDKGKP